MRLIAISLIALLIPLADGHAVQDKNKDEPKTIELPMLQKNGGAQFGAWTVWNYAEGDKAVFMVHANSGLVIYLPWSSNGWINYRSKDGDWHVSFSKGPPKKQDRSDLKVEPFLAKKTTLVLEPGKYRFETWAVNITKDAIEFRCTTTDDRLTIRRMSGDAVHNGRGVGGKN
ncbi:MAG: hypothetical protein HYR84_09900 [Planctomycetes bacterium]|nr:hypothetical protein [Planctomycetota bacterium]